MSAEQRVQRHADHELVNRIIGETVDAVQDQIIDRHSPWFDFVDKLLGPVDEWLTSRLISHWREEVWDNAVRYLESLRSRSAKPCGSALKNRPCGWAAASSQSNRKPCHTAPAVDAAVPNDTSHSQIVR